MLNSIITQDHDGQELFNAISSFFRSFGIGNLLCKCNAQKEKGVPVLDIFKYDPDFGGIAKALPSEYWTSTPHGWINKDDGRKGV